MKKVKQLSVIAASTLLIGNIAYADFGDAVVGGIVGGAVGSVITNEVYQSKKQSSQPQRQTVTKKYYAPAPQLNDEKRIQTALSSLGFYRGRIDGQVNSYETRSAIKEMNMAYEISQSASLKPEAKDTIWQLRIGIHTGPLVAGVIGEKKFAYDVWGDTVNIASRLETSGMPGRINISSLTYDYVKDFFDCEYRGKIEAKNKGAIDMYFVKGIRQELSFDIAGLIPNKEFLRMYNELQSK